ncbi:MAG: PCMD domain-containing protein [Muribaculaceae bacterium]|nr:PCMD domain-containing protein [Muribaculaceae bacterium]
MKRFLSYIIILAAMQVTSTAAAETLEPLRYGDFEQWVTRDIHESGIIGGKQKNVYAIGPNMTIAGNKPYVPTGGSPWASSNVMARVAGITKTSNAVFPDTRPEGGRCAKLTTLLEECKALGIVNIKVMVAGSMFLGRMLEPLTSTNDPYSKMEMGVPFTKRPDALCFDYSLLIPEGNKRIYSSGFSKQRTLEGHDNAEVIILLQRRWEDAEGNIYAKRVGTGCEILDKNTSGWVNHHHLPVHYGDITSEAYYNKYMQLIPESHSYYARNSKGKMVPVKEVGWDAPDATPTHMIVMFSASSGEPYTGTPGLTLWVDNVALAY